MKNRIPLCLVLLVGSFIGPESLLANASAWKAGMSKVSITPEQPVRMAGYASRKKPFQRVEHDLFAKAMALEDAQGNRAVLITTDLVGIPGPIAESISKRIQEQTSLTRAQIVLSATHTHSGPLLTDDEKTRYSNISPEEGRKLFLYTQAFQVKMVRVATEALDALQPARLTQGTGLAHFTMNRRQFTPNGVVLGVNPRGLVDRSVPVLRVDDESGSPLAVLFSYACHNTTLTGGNHSLCGDYAGFAQLHIQHQFPGTLALFMMGCGGDANPHPRGTMTLARDHGAALGAEVCRVLQGNLKPVSGPLQCRFGKAPLPLESFDRETLSQMAAKGPSWRRGNASGLLRHLDENGSLPKVYPTPVSVWQFGEDFTLVCLSGEVVVDYVPLLEEALGPLNLWLTAYCHDVFGYVPSRKVLREGGYECRGLYIAPGFFAAESQEILIKTVRELAIEAGRKSVP